MVLPCFVCEQRRTSRPDKHGNLPRHPTRRCLLGNRDFCDTHKGAEPDVCEINHHAYHCNHRQLQGVYPTMEARQKAVGSSADVVSLDGPRFSFTCTFDTHSGPMKKDMERMTEARPPTEFPYFYPTLLAPAKLDTGHALDAIAPCRCRPSTPRVSAAYCLALRRGAHRAAWP